MTAAKSGRFDPEMSAAMQLAVDDLEAFKSGKTAKYKPRTVPVSSDRAGEILQTAARESRSPSFNCAIKFKSGKGGTVQHRFVVELPHELNAAERAGLARRFAQHLGNLSVDEDGNPIGMMYTAVVHAPDAHNDKRNYHLHIIAHDRPAKFNDTYKMWDFEIPAISNRGGEVRVSYPLRQKKIAEVNGNRKSTAGKQASKDFIPELRRTYARMANEALERAGVEKRYDPRSYKAMGVERQPTKHLGTKAASLEAAGVATDVGKENAAIIWDDTFRQIEARAEKRKTAQRKRSEVLLANVAALPTMRVNATEQAAYRQLVATHDAIASDIAEDRKLIETFNTLEKRTKSRAIKTREASLQTLVDIDNGVANRFEMRSRGRVLARYREAQEWIDTIDRALANEREPLAAAEKSVTEREAQLVEVNSQLDAMWRNMINASAKAERKAEEAAAKKPKIFFLPDDAVGPGNYIDTRRAPTQQTKSTPPPTPETPVAPPTQAADKPEPMRAAPPATKQSEQPNPQTPVTDNARPTKDVKAPIEKPIDAARTTETRAELPSASATTEMPAAGPNKSAETPTNQIEQAKPATPDVPTEGTQSLAPAEPKQAGPTDVEAQQPEAVTPATGGRDQPPATEPTKPATLEEITRPRTPASTEPPTPTAKPPKEVDEPTLFELPKQEAPIKPGSPEERQKLWEDVFDRISRDHLLVVPSTTHADRFDVRGLKPEEREILGDPQLLNRTRGRLKTVYGFQEQTVGRLREWLKANAPDPAKVQIRGSELTLLDAPRAIMSIYDNYANHPAIAKQVADRIATQRKINTVVEWIGSPEGRSPNAMDLTGRRLQRINASEKIEALMKELITEPQIKQALAAEYERREASRQKARAVSNDLSSTAALESRYEPMPSSYVLSSTLRDLVLLLNERASANEIAEAARKVRNDQQASEEVYQHGVGLAVAYTQALQDRPVTHISRDRSRGRDF